MESKHFRKTATWTWNHWNLKQKHKLTRRRNYCFFQYLFRERNSRHGILSVLNCWNIDLRAYGGGESARKRKSPRMKAEPSNENSLEFQNSNIFRTHKTFLLLSVTLRLTLWFWLGEQRNSRQWFAWKSASGRKSFVHRNRQQPNSNEKNQRSTELCNIIFWDISYDFWSANDSMLIVVAKIPNNAIMKAFVSPTASFLHLFSVFPLSEPYW